ncbi:MAG: hypothetical protein ACI86M_002713 [Saprospiraceae bacterium]|jgi:hypothetical protein
MISYPIGAKILSECLHDGKIDGEIQYMIRIESLTDIPAAYIPIQYKDAKGNLIKDSVLLIKRNKNWYLIGM